MNNEQIVMGDMNAVFLICSPRACVEDLHFYSFLVLEARNFMWFWHFFRHLIKCMNFLRST